MKILRKKQESAPSKSLPGGEAFENVRLALRTFGLPDFRISFKNTHVFPSVAPSKSPPGGEIFNNAQSCFRSFLKNTHVFPSVVLACLLLFAACSPTKGPYAVTNKVYAHQADSFARVLTLQQPAMLTDSSGLAVPSDWVGTVNVNMRKPNFVIIHYTAQDSAKQTLKTFTVVHSQVSAHYVIGKDGKVYHMVSDYLRAWHAGASKWGHVTDMNSCSIGIELDNSGFEPFASEQMKSLLALLARLKKAYGIPTANFIGHEDIAPLRKPDPGTYFPWKLMAAHGFGYWSDDVLEVAPDNFDAVQAMRIIGYDVSDLNSAIAAFKRHFVQTDVTPVLTQLDLNVLYNVYQKY